MVREGLEKKRKTRFCTIGSRTEEEFAVFYRTGLVSLGCRTEKEGREKGWGKKSGSLPLPPSFSVDPWLDEESSFPAQGRVGGEKRQFCSSSIELPPSPFSLRASPPPLSFRRFLSIVPNYCPLLLLLPCGGVFFLLPAAGVGTSWSSPGATGRNSFIFLAAAAAARRRSGHTLYSARVRTAPRCQRIEKGGWAAG